MKKVILFIYLLCPIIALAQTTNTLKVADVAAMPGGDFYLPIVLTNEASNIVATQFELTLPEGATIDTQSATLADRASNHVATVKANSGVYRVMIFANDNQPIRGNSGTLATLKVTLGESFKADETYAISLVKATLSDPDGNRIPVETEDGILSISPSPDFVVGNVLVDNTTIRPDGTLTVSWTVNNQGRASSQGGWSEQISLVSSDGTTKLIGTLYYEEALTVGSSVSRQAELKIPTLLGIDGSSQIQVRLIPNKDSGETAEYQGNNTTRSSQTLSVGKQLVLTLPDRAEEANTTLRCQLARSGSWMKDETFTLSLQGDERVAAPESVTIKAGQSSANFTLTLTDDETLNDEDSFIITASGNGYEAVAATLVVEDNEYPDLSLTASESEVTEGDTFTLTVSLPKPAAEAVAVTISSENSKRFSYPSLVTIPAGEASAMVEVTAVDNDEIELQESIAFYASAEKHERGECIVILNDNDMPTLTFTLSPEAVSESDGYAALFGVIKRTDNLDKRVTIKLSDDSNGLLTYTNQTIVMAKNQAEVQFNIGVTDNNYVDGNHTVNVTATVYAASCNCSVTDDSKEALNATVTIIDDDGPTLKIKPAGTSILEGSEDNVFTISHNIKSDSDIKVSISSDKDDVLEYDHELTIPAGQTSASLLVNVKSNDQQDDSSIAAFKVEADGYAQGTCWILVTDQTLPDAVISLSTDKKEVDAEQTVLLRAVVKNVGNSILRSTTPVEISFSGRKKTVGLTIGKSLAVGDSAVIEYNYDLPAITGNYTFEATVNASGKVPELIYANNTSEKVVITLLPPFSVTAQTDKDIYLQSDSIYITGTATGSAGKNANIEVYIIHEGARLSINATSDEKGNYSVAWKPLSMQSGHFIIGACYPGSKAGEEMDAFDVYGLQAKSKKDGKPFERCELCNTETYSGTIIVKNPGVLAQTGFTVTPKAQSTNCVFTYDAPTSIGAGESIEIGYTIYGDSISEGTEWQQMPLEISTSEGSHLDYIIYYYVHPLKAKLRATNSHIKTTITYGKVREYPVTIRNVGKTETGKITLALPNWIQAVTPNEMASLAQGDSTTIMLRFIPTEAMKLNVRVSGHIGINCANGDGTSISFYLTPVSEEKGTLKVDVVDEYTYFTNEAPHVSKAKVRVKNPSTNEVVAEGETADDGTFSAELPEGYYSVTVDADKHDSYANTIIVDPGVEKEEEVFLSYQAITYSWDVQETGVEDEYEIETIVKYETRVPKPVVIITLPDEQPEPNSIIPVIVTNKGLVNALDFNLSLSVNNGYTLEFLNDQNLDILPPQQSHVFYAKLVPTGGEKTEAHAHKAGRIIRCIDITARGHYKEPCEKNHGTETTIKEKSWGSCTSTGGSGNGRGSTGGSGGGPGHPGDWRNIYINEHYIIDYIGSPAKNCDGTQKNNGSTPKNNDNSSDDPVNRNKVDEGEPDKQPCDSQEEPILVYKIVPVSGNRYEMNGVAADGVSQVKIVLDPDSSRIPEDDCENIVDIKWELSQDRGSIEGNSLRESIYTAPDGLSTQHGASEFVEATVWYTQRTDKNTTWGRHSMPIKIEIIRPPVLIVHGLFDDADDWKRLEESLSPAKYDDLYYKKNINYRLDYKSTKTHSLNENYPLIGKGIHKVQHRALVQGYVSTKCDIVGFGQGGILTRLYVQNGGDGINKIITMNTPHAGSEWADGIEGHKVVFGNIMKGLFFNTNIDAIYDLGVNSSAINNLNAMSSLKLYNDIPVHTMATQNGVQSWVGTQGLGALLGIGGEIATKFGPIGIVVGITAKYFRHFYTDDWSQVGIGDGYVSTASQVGGCSANTIKDWGFGHKDIPKHYSTLTLQELLLADKNGTLFSNNWFHPEPRYFDHENWLSKWIIGEVVGVAFGHFGKKVTNKFVKGGDKVLHSYYDKVKDKTIEIMASEMAVSGGMEAGSFIASAGEYIRQNSDANAKSMKRVVDADNGEKYLFFKLNESEGYSEPLIVVSYGEDSYVMDEGFSVDIKVPSTFNGDAKILVFMKNNNDSILYQDYVYTIESPMAKPVSLSIEEMTLEANDNETMRLYCTWNDGSETRVIPERVSFDYTNIATFVDDCILGLSPGLTNATAYYKGLSCTGQIRVFASDEEEGDSDDSPSICSTITLSFKQKNVMTRQAFRGTLTVDNGNETTAMKDVKMNLEVRDMDGNLTTSHEFQIDAESLKGFTGNLNFTSGWTLQAGGTGVATILFIPTKYAAPTEPKDYSFGGSFSYTDPYTGLTVTRDLNPVTLTVNPSPNLEMTYFMQRDVFGDDPLTETVEPMIPSEFALLINNKGYGDAENMNLTTHQPEIIDNQKGLAITFELISSQLNGGDMNLSLGGSMTSDFGTIPTHSQAYAQWWLQSSLLGHFIEYDVKATHLTSRNNPDLSLLDTVTVHELIHGFTVPADDETMRGFLVNDVADANDLPDQVYLTDATQADVSMATAATITKQTNQEYYVLTVTPAQEGWNYGKVDDPTHGKQNLVRIVRQSDGTELPVDNIWQTDRTLRDGKDPLYENMLHYIVCFPSASTETFMLTFEPKPEVELEVEAFEGVPEEGTVLKEQLKTVTVRFNKPINASSFTADDIRIACQGTPLETNKIGITKTSDKEYLLDLQAVDLNDGYYVLTVQTAGITDAEGFNGTAGKSAAWIQYTGKIALQVTVDADSMGTVTPGTSLVDYGETITLKAVPNEGYEFASWKSGDEVLATEEEYTIAVTEAQAITATFKPKYFLAEIVYEEERGTVEGHASGYYPFHEYLQMKAVPKDGFDFSHWNVNGEENGHDAILKHLLSSAVNIEAIFKAHVPILGDVNRDGTITIADVTALVNYILGKPDPDFDLSVADVNSDGTITIADVTALVNIILGK